MLLSKKTQFFWYKICIHSFKKLEKWNLNFLKKSFKFKKFSVLKSPFKYNKNREQYVLRKFKYLIKHNEYSPKVYEILFYNYLFLSNTKFFFFLKLEKRY